MKLLREFLLLRALRRLLAGRRDAVRHYTVTVPAPLDCSASEQSAGSNVIELHRRTTPVTSRAPTPTETDAVPLSGHLALASSR